MLYLISRMRLLKQKRNPLAIILLFVFSPILYWQLNRVGYLPPINYWLGKDNLNDNFTLSSLPTKLLNYQQPIESLVTKSIDRSQTAILIEKSKYQLTLYYKNEAIKSYPIVLGSNPVGDKRREGDYKTPEGVFQVRDLYSHPTWSKFIWLDYPNRECWRKHLKAKSTGEIKFLDTVGSEIGIHGVPRNSDRLIDNRTNWTWGCISFKNKDVDEVYGVIQTGTKIEILP